jgi:N-acetylglutamate synthase-like GNAT family acetyltransferase
MEINVYKPEDKAEIINLILTIQKKEFEIDIDLKSQPDLENIQSYYQKGKGNFWVAKINNSIMGTISLLDIGDNHSALRKMFVKKEFRGKEYGVGQALLNTVINWTHEKQFKKIFLGTTEKFIAAQRFYEKNGFIEIDKNLLPKEFPLMKVDVKFYEYSV